MAAVAGDGIEILFFSWRRALFGLYDIFHLHWPEGLLRRGSGPAALFSYWRVRALIMRLKRCRIPVVYTVHNVAPHEDWGDGRLNKVVHGFEALTRAEIHLVPEPDRKPVAPAAVIPHGNYHEAFAPHPRLEMEAGRCLFFGLIRPYKGVEELVSAFDELDDNSASLRIVGKVMDNRLREAIVRSTQRDGRVTARFGFVSDAELVGEVSQSQLVILPYRNLHSSGVAIVALSLSRPILVPDSATTRALRDEVGSEWVQIFTPPVSADDIHRALQVVGDTPRDSSPDLSARSWEKIRYEHAKLYRAVLDRPTSSKIL
ncbi:glycosyltransferase [Microbacterium sp.]|uniref:glycosyltransferase n=1 Tax=Microbacterium sp. TaxID=51671 RepID=UPI0039E50EB7